MLGKQKFRKTKIYLFTLKSNNIYKTPPMKSNPTNSTVTNWIKNINLEYCFVAGRDIDIKSNDPSEGYHTLRAFVIPVKASS